ncbi:MAG TPA: hypothetical protein VN982_15355 [Candidatus Dormibacteraeota bacterium]|nr:hypothetical protein [Candidatus Dormibacteraeota bacterium]
MKLDAEGSRKIAGMLREHAKLIRELASAKSLLRFCQENKVYPKNYEQELEEAQKHPAYAKIAQEIDIVAAHLEQVAEEIDVSELLKQIPQGNLPS